MNERDQEMVAKVKSISEKGKSAEVKWEKNKGKYVIYEVEKKRTTVG